MRRSIIRALVASAFVVPGLSQANDLLDSYREALNQDTTLRAAKFQRDAAVEARPQALSAFLPQLNAQGSIERDRNSIKQTSTRIVTTPTDPAASVTTTQNFTYYNTAEQFQVTLTQTIWSFESFFRLKQADFTVAQAEATYRSAQQRLILRVAQAYFNVLSATDTVRTNTAERTANERQLLQAKKRFEVGLAAITDVQEAQASFDASVATLIASERTLSNAQRALAEITGRYADTAQALREEIPLIAPSPATPDEWLQASRKENYDLQIARLGTEIAERNTKAIRARHLPTLALNASYGESYNSSTFNSDANRGAIGASINVPIFSGGLTSSQVRQAAAQAEQSRAGEEGTLRSIERQTRDAFQGVISGIASVNASLASVKSSQTALESSQVGLQVGTRTEVDVLNTLRNLYVAQRTYYQSRYDYLISVLTLKQQAGRLTEADLSNIDALLTSTDNLPPVPVPTAPTGK
ncbi:MAG: efflux transporter outer membrane subunit OpmH [Nevskia sp.]